MKLKISVVLFLSTLFWANAQHQIKGKVCLADGSPVPFVPISIHETYLSKSADETGAFVFNNLKPGKYILVVKTSGYKIKYDTVLVPQAQVCEVKLKPDDINLDEIIVKTNRVNKGSGMAFSDVSKEQLDKQNLGQDVPLLLNNLTSVVASSDAGNGIGYTGIRIRGSDATRVNVTINGVPVNDAESQGTFWVNMPDLTSSLNSIQVQRGVGASSNGAGAFGASINLETNALNEKPYAQVIATAGSFNTMRATLAAGSGLIAKKFAVDVRGSQISSDGYIDRASSLLRSYYLSGGYYGKKTVIKAISFNGWEKTYQAWYYVPEDSIKKGNRTFNPAGQYFDANGKAQYYDNETDNYNQNNNQLHFIHTINDAWRISLTGHYTKGKGYYEQFKQGEPFAKYGLPDFDRNGTTITNSDLVRRLWLDNDFAGGLGYINYRPNKRLDITLGGAFNSYFGRHFGKVVSNKEGNPFGTDYRYYFNTSNKNDGNVYIKTNFKPNEKLNVFVDLQYRNVEYRFEGFNDQFKSGTQLAYYSFFNPKFGMSWDMNEHNNAYASFAIGNKEPNRDDFVQSTPGSRPKAEQMMDVELGWKQQYQKVAWGINGYHMQYNNQLVLNGQVNNVGAYNRVNAGTSFRRGLELEAKWQIIKQVGVNGNLTLSQNKILLFDEYIDTYDANYNYLGQTSVQHKNVDISFSPSVISAMGLVVTPIKGLDLTFQNKYVGKQYLDNTMNANRAIAAYNVTDVLVSYTIKTRIIKEIVITGAVYNVLSTTYVTNGYTYVNYVGNDLMTYNSFAPAAPVNFLGGLKLRF